MKFLASLALMTLLPLDAHEGSKKNSKPTAARQDLKDARKARLLTADRSYKRVKTEGEAFKAQEYFINHYR